jgi:hypothetical protein
MTWALSPATASSRSPVSWAKVISPDTSRGCRSMSRDRRTAHRTNTAAGERREGGRAGWRMIPTGTTGSLSAHSIVKVLTIVANTSVASVSVNCAPCRRADRGRTADRRSDRASAHPEKSRRVEDFRLFSKSAVPVQHQGATPAGTARRPASFVNRACRTIAQAGGQWRGASCTTAGV